MNMLRDTFQADDATVGSAKLREDLYDRSDPLLQLRLPPGEGGGRAGEPPHAGHPGRLAAAVPDGGEPGAAVQYVIVSDGAEA